MVTAFLGRVFAAVVDHLEVIGVGVAICISDDGLDNVDVVGVPLRQGIHAFQLAGIGHWDPLFFDSRPF